MNDLFLSPLLAAINHNVVFGALIGIESLYLLTRLRQHGTFRLWGLLLPVMLGTALIDNRIILLLGAARAGYLAPLVTATIAAIGAFLLLRVHRRLNRRATEKEAGLLYFASIAALLIAIPWGDAKNVSLLPALRSATEIWFGYGIGMVCFSSLGGRLHGLTSRSSFAGIALLFLTIAVIALTLAGLSGLQPVFHR